MHATTGPTRAERGGGIPCTRIQLGIDEIPSLAPSFRPKLNELARAHPGIHKAD